jgi:hypothetical protein
VHPRRRDLMRGSVSQVAAGTIEDDDKVPDPGERPPIAPASREPYRPAYHRERPR